GFDSTPEGLVTVICAVPAVATRLAGTWTMACDPLKQGVEQNVPDDWTLSGVFSPFWFHVTIAPAPNPPPVMVRRKPGLRAAIVAGFRNVTRGLKSVDGAVLLVAYE